MSLLVFIFCITVSNSLLQASTFTVLDKSGKPMASVMVMQSPVSGYTLDTSDKGYPPERKINHSNTVHTAFTDLDGKVTFNSYQDKKVRLRFRFPDHQDINIQLMGSEDKTLVLIPITDPLLLAESRPANTWLAALNIKNDAYLKKHYIMQCGFCHQQGSRFFRRPRSEESWDEIIYRMIGYGSRLHDEAQELLPKILADEYLRLYKNPQLIPKATPWHGDLKNTTITEWPIGDAFSQMHDLLYHSNGMVYVGDNIQDRLYEINPETAEYTLYKLKREASDKHGGLLGKRLSAFPKHDTFAGIHSLAESPIDGHIFITTSHQQRLVEFDPKSKTFTNYKMDDGYYPHTIRVDKKDRVWFTMALSNQIAMFNRKTKEFKMFDLPSRSFKESVTVSSMGSILTMMDWGVPLANWVSIDAQSTGLPLPYGIDITPDGNIWFARLHANTIGMIDGKTFAMKEFKTPFLGPRRLRSDSKGNLWIAAFPESMIVKFDPKKETFTNYPLPVKPLGSETPYSLNVDVKRDRVWVNGNASDALYRYDIDTATWSHFPLSKRVTFTRDVEFAPNGDVFVTNSSFPSWHIEDGQPTLIRVHTSEEK
ncbi:MAG: hypothetical protein COA74_02820 [Gammaproteobacteria bacterium]|nr:MAG: hypothetical protein COA74_02820 [Gammaproteobacteria bacterium]